MEEIYGGRGVVEREKSVLGRGGRRGGAGGQPHEQEKVRVGGPTWAKGGVGWLGLALSRLFFFFMCYNNSHNIISGTELGFIT